MIEGIQVSFCVPRSALGPLDESENASVNNVQGPAEFHKFLELPTEMQLSIWQHAMALDSRHDQRRATVYTKADLGQLFM